MGKKHQTKKRNVFKVAGSKSLKAKKKAKVVQGQLKKIAELNQKKIAQIDQQLSAINDKLRQGNKQETNVIKPISKVKKMDVHDQETATKAMDKLQTLKM